MSISSRSLHVLPALDPLPTSFIKQHYTCHPNTTNESLRKGSVPFDAKEAVNKPLLKKQGLVIFNLSNYRPVSNVPFPSKIIESDMVARLRDQSNIASAALIWYESYLRERTRAVAIRDPTAPSVELQRGVSQILAMKRCWTHNNTIVHDLHISQRKHRTPSRLQWAFLYAALCFVWHQGRSISSSPSNGGMCQGHQDVDGSQSSETKWQQDGSDNIHG